MTLNKLQIVTDELKNISKFRDMLDLSNYGFSVVFLASTTHRPPNRPTVAYAYYYNGEPSENLSYRRFFFDETGLIISMEEFEARYFNDHEDRFVRQYKQMYKKPRR